MKKTSIIIGLMTMGLFAGAQTRMSLYEEFTGENCGPCAQTNPGLDALISSNSSKVIMIKWQVPIPSAPSATWSLYQTGKNFIDWRWKTTGSGGYGYLCATCSPTAGYINYAPQGRLDGQELNTFGINQGGSTNHPGYLTAAAISSAQAQSTSFSISTIGTAWDATFDNCTVTFTVSTPNTGFTANGNLKCRVVLVERNINFLTAPGSNGEKDFHEVIRQVYNTTPANPTSQITDFGYPLPGTWNIGDAQTFSVSLAVPSYIVDKSQMAFVVFIQDDGDRQIWQAERSSLAAIPNDIKLVSVALPSYSCANAFNPSINITNQGPNAVTDMTIVPTIDGVPQTAVIWTGNLASSTNTNLALGTYTAGPGSHTISIDITGVSGGDVNTVNNSGSVVSGLVQTYAAGPVVEPFTNTAFPPANWFVVNTDKGPSWSRNGAAGFNGAGAAKYDFFNNGNTGDADEMFITPSDLTGMPAPMLSFDVAYAQYASENDRLEVLVSTNCGATWSSIFNKAGSVLKTVSPQTSAFTPASNSMWRNETVALPATAANNPSVLVKFVATTDYGNNLYVDNINVANNITALKTYNPSNFNIQLFPNPSTDFTNLDINTNEATKATISIYNTLGQVVYVNETDLSKGFNHFQINTNEFAAGMYSLVISSEFGKNTLKLTVTK